MNSGPLSPPETFHLSAALGWIELGLKGEARHELNQLEHCREHPDVIETWWKLLSEEQDWTAALSCAKRLLQAAPDRSSAWISYSFALHELKRTREAFEHLHSVANRFSDQFIIPFNLACYQCQLGDHTEAMRWLRRAASIADPRSIRSMALEDPDLAPLREQVSRLL